MTATECQCDESGWCERHQCTKTDNWIRLCKTRPKYFDLWENGVGPGQTRTEEVGRPPCRYLGEKAGELDCQCSGDRSYFHCLHPDIEFAVKRKENRRPAIPKTTSCLSCQEYQPFQEPVP